MQATAHRTLVCDGDFHIDGKDDLKLLKRCKRITGSLTISDTALTDLSALSRLSAVDGNLYIYNNENLISLSGLTRLRNLGGRLIIQNNDALKSVEGLHGVTVVHALNDDDPHIGMDGRPSSPGQCALKHHHHPAHRISAGSIPDLGGLMMGLDGPAALIIGVLVLIVVIAAAAETVDDPDFDYRDPQGDPSIAIRGNDALCEGSVASFAQRPLVRGFVRSGNNDSGC